MKEGDYEEGVSARFIIFLALYIEKVVRKEVEILQMLGTALGDDYWRKASFIRGKNVSKMVSNQSWIMTHIQGGHQQHYIS